MKSNRIVAALIIWSGLLTVLVVAMLLSQKPQPVQAQLGVASFSTMRVGSFYRAVPRTAITVTMNGWLTPTGTYQRIRNTTGAVATSGAKIAIKPEGTILKLFNVGANSITFTETSITSAGNIVLGAGDVAELMSDGTAWTQTSGSNN